MIGRVCIGLVVELIHDVDVNTYGILPPSLVLSLYTQFQLAHFLPITGRE